MAYQCPKCDSTFSVKYLDGSSRTACPICKSPIVGQATTSAAASPRAVAPQSTISAPKLLATGSEPTTVDPLANIPVRLGGNLKYGAEMAQIAPPWVVLSLMIFFTVMGVGFAVGGYFANAEKKASLSWPTVPGRITSCQLREVRNKPRSLPYEIVRYMVDVTYDYTVGGTTYNGTKIALSDDLKDLGSAQSRANRYAVATTHDVHYNPSNPRRAVLEPGETYSGDTAGIDTILGVWLPLALIPLVLIFLSMYLVMKRDLPRKVPG